METDEEKLESTISAIKEDVEKEIFDYNSIGALFTQKISYSVPYSEENISSKIFIFFAEYQKIFTNGKFDVFLSELIILYFDLIDGFREEIEILKIQRNGKHELTSRLEIIARDCENIMGYLQHELNRYEVYNDMLITNVSSENLEKPKVNKLSVPERLVVLEKIGFKGLEFVKGLNDADYKVLMSTILNCDKRSIDGYINSEKENSDESKYIITNKHTENADKFLKQFLRS